MGEMAFFWIFSCSAGDGGSMHASYSHQFLNEMWALVKPLCLVEVHCTGVNTRKCWRTKWQSPSLWTVFICVLSITECTTGVIMKGVTSRVMQQWMVCLVVRIQFTVFAFCLRGYEKRSRRLLWVFYYNLKNKQPSYFLPKTNKQTTCKKWRRFLRDACLCQFNFLEVELFKSSCFWQYHSYVCKWKEKKYPELNLLL